MEEVKVLINTFIKPNIKRELMAINNCCWTEILAISRKIHYGKHNLVEKGVSENKIVSCWGYLQERAIFHNWPRIEDQVKQ
jgi:hypothetical protein